MVGQFVILVREGRPVSGFNSKIYPAPFVGFPANAPAIIVLLKPATSSRLATTVVVVAETIRLTLKTEPFEEVVVHIPGTIVRPL